ncbi:sigma-54-dependent Fis family transcriptional regulator [Ancylobacter defluvii]|uniref:Sigma-54-dependent Fis family transcriptional regulator n=1 Tax=Ancylobacter defluvii TaxID=1282440 RepID=A0A9W6NDA5_9HYPH|nr:sigma-54-dependent Fis family transcriptional regulator [Ancylobacter defluvii]MBS7588123.1 sigma-54-dependent Fis family transcriptional regulator [Ancylobacter defluvii]GLK86515.1 sigma-54-dependent Fis family transcriptional regulator [Ancylobacter defluvii]
MRADTGSKAVSTARRQFFNEGRPPQSLVAEPILRSWRRCADLGLDNQVLPSLVPLTEGELRRASERNERLRRLSRPEIESLYAEAMQTGCVIILTDASGLILESRGHTAFASRAAQVALRPGVDWSESATGTNAVGTALLEGRPIAVHGGEHYFDPHGILSCSAAPIMDPFGRAVGVLDLSGPAAVDHRHALGLVRLAAEQIEHRFFDDGFAGLQVLRLGADRALLGTAREGVLVFDDGRLVAANRHGLGLFGIDWSALGTRSVDELVERLPQGAGIARMETAGRGVLFGRMDGEETVPSRPRGARMAPRGLPQFGELLLREEDERGLLRAVKMIDAGVPVLIQGETGTGKEMAAREVHRRGPRAAAPFVAVNCAAIPETLIEAELFGYEEGAFTGARRHGRKGLLREAEGGVLFLDEIGDMPLSLQSRLLRVLQDREVLPLGGGRPVSVDFALVCATHRHLKGLVESGTFRSDLYFRIAHYTIELPAVRDLPDRLATVRELWRRVARDERLVLTAACEERLAAYDWPGNFRQLVGVLRMLAALAEPGQPVGTDLLPQEVSENARPQPARAASDAPASEPADLDAIELAAMRRALDAHGGNVSKAARALGINRSTLYRRLLSTH